MAFFRRKPPPPPAPPPPPPPALPAEPPPSRRMTDAVATPTVVGPGTRIRGELTGDDPVDLGGTLEGDSRVTALYRVRAGGRVTGNVTAGSLVVEGELSGATLAAGKVEIGATARVRADIRARTVAIAEGAFFDGQVHMEGRDAEGPEGPVRFREKRKGR